MVLRTKWDKVTKVFIAGGTANINTFERLRQNKLRSFIYRKASWTLLKEKFYSFFYIVFTNLVVHFPPYNKLRVAN